MSRSRVTLLPVALFFFALNLFASRPHEQGPVILCYHVVGANGSGEHAISREAFVRQMSYLARNGYRVITLAELSEHLAGNGGPLPSNAVVVTVDDGWRSTLTEVLPVMKRFNFPFTAFIYPRFVGNGGLSLSWDEIRGLSKQGVDIQSHTFSHPFLTRKRQRSRSGAEYASWLRHELRDSRMLIEKETGRPVRFLAYPYGDYDARVIEAAAAAGYRAALTCNEGPIVATADVYRLRRFAIDRTTTLDLFRRYVAQAGAARPVREPEIRLVAEPKKRVKHPGAALAAVAGIVFPPIGSVLRLSPSGTPQPAQSTRDRWRSGIAAIPARREWDTEDSELDEG